MKSKSLLKLLFIVDMLREERKHNGVVGILQIHLTNAIFESDNKSHFGPFWEIRFDDNAIEEKRTKIALEVQSNDKAKTKTKTKRGRLIQFWGPRSN